MSDFYVRENFYRGFVHTNGKVPLDEYKDKTQPLPTYNDVKDSEAYSGVVAENSVVIDCDTMEDAEMVLQIVKAENVRTLVYRSNHGMHFLFRNNDGYVTKNSAHNKNNPKIEVALGLMMTDVRCGKTNGCECLKKYNTELTVEYDSGETIGDEVVYDELPCWLRPVDCSDTFKYVNFRGMGDGSGRNQQLFTYEVCLIRQNKFTKAECVETLRVINKYMFDEPLADDEFTKITRKEALPEATPDYIVSGKSAPKLDIPLFADWLRENLKISLLRGVLYYYRDGIYRQCCGIDNDLGHIAHCCYERLTEHEWKELVGNFNRSAPVRQPTSPNFILFKNCIFDISKQTPIKHSSDYIFKNKIPHDLVFDESQFKQSTIDFVNKTFMAWCCGRSDLVEFLFELIGHTFYRNNKFRPVFLLSGDGQNGKSTFMNLVTFILTGELPNGYEDTEDSENISYLTMQELSERFKRVRLVDRLVNICADIPATYIEDPSILKMCASGDKFDVEYKGKNGFSFRPYATMLFACNTIPKFSDKTDGITSRIFPIPFDAKFSQNDRDFDPYLEVNLLTEEVAEYVIYRALKALLDILDNKGFRVPQCITDAKRAFQMTNDPVCAYFAEKSAEDFIGHTTQEAFIAYQDWCDRYDIDSRIKQKDFTNRVNKEFGLCTTERTADRKHRVYQLAS